MDKCFCFLRHQQKIKNSFFSTGLFLGMILPLAVNSLCWQSWKGLTKVPGDIPSYCTAVSLSMNTIPHLWSGEFSHLTKCTELILHWDQISVIDEGAFQGLNNLLKLSLYKNRISEIPHGAFAGLGNLQELDLSVNSITHLPSGIFSYLTQCKKLNLYNN